MSNPGFNSSGGGGQGLAGNWSPGPTRREASVVLVDRTLDLAAAASHGGSLLQRVRQTQQFIMYLGGTFCNVSKN